MGSWSVYCGISKIVITSGQECVFIPLKKSMSESGSRLIPATLPIFGEYDDYGGMENIIKDENTKLIEEHFDCTIEEFCHYFTRGCVRDDEDDFPKKLKEKTEMKDWDFMFIDKKVYDFMGNFVSDSYGGVGQLDFGNHELLIALGFEFVGKDESLKRYDRVYKLGDKLLYSDGTWAHQDKKGHDAIYHFDGDECGSNLIPAYKISEDKMWIGKKSMWKLWEIFSDSDIRKKVGRIIGIDDRYSDDSLDEFLEKMMEEEKDPAKLAVYARAMGGCGNKITPTSTLLDKYRIRIREFGKLLCELTTIRYNLYPMSGSFDPHQLYVTPQCGERDAHQQILNKFASIHQEYLDKYKED